MKKLLLALLGATLMTAVSQAQIVTLWDDQDPTGGNITQIADPFGTGHGNIGEFTSNGQPQWSNYTLSGQDWSAYAGKDWTVSVDIYITAAQAGDTNITDDIVYFAVGSNQGGYADLTNLNVDQWNTITWSGTFDAEPTNLTSSLVRLLDNHKNTHPATGANYYTDNYKLVVDTSVPAAKYFSVDNLNLRPANAANPTKIKWAGTESEGTIDVQPDYVIPVSPPNTFYASPVEIELRWSGLTLDDTGIADDYVDFTFQAYATSGGNAGFGSQGIGDGYSIFTNQPNEGVILRVSNVSLSPTTAGSVEFAGFTSGAIGVGDYTDPRSWEVQIDINGITVSGAQTNGASGYGTYRVPENSFTNTVMTYSNAVFGVDEFLDAMFVRDYDLLFSWSTNQPPVYIDVIVTNDIEFVASEGFVDGDVNGQVDMVSAGSSWNVAVAGAGSATSTNSSQNMTLNKSINGLSEGDTVRITADYKFLGTPEDLVPGGTNQFDGYYINVGLSTNNSGNAILAAKDYAEAVRFQRFYTPGISSNVCRLFRNNWSGPATDNQASPVADDELTIVYELTVGADAGSTTLDVALINRTQSLTNSGSYSITSPSIYTALTGPDGAFPYVEAGGLTLGVTGIEVDRIEVIYASTALLVDGFGDWIADYGLSGSPDADQDYDYDGDGVDNLAEYALNGNPDDINDKGFTSMSISGGTVTYSHAALLADPTVTYVLVSAPNLVYGPWTTNSVSGTDPFNPDYEEWSYSVPADTDNKFIKLIISK